MRSVPPMASAATLYEAFGDALADALLDDETLDEIIVETREMFIPPSWPRRDAGRNRLLET